MGVTSRPFHATAERTMGGEVLETPCPKHCLEMEPLLRNRAIFRWHCGLPRTSVYVPVLFPVRQCKLILAYFNLFLWERKYAFHIGKLKSQMA